MVKCPHYERQTNFESEASVEDGVRGANDAEGGSPGDGRLVIDMPSG